MLKLFCSNLLNMSVEQQSQHTSWTYTEPLWVSLYRIARDINNAHKRFWNSDKKFTMTQSNTFSKVPQEKFFVYVHGWLPWIASSGTWTQLLQMHAFGQSMRWLCVHACAARAELENLAFSMVFLCSSTRVFVPSSFSNIGGITLRWSSTLH